MKQILLLFQSFKQISYHAFCFYSENPPYTPEELAERNRLAKEFTKKSRLAENEMILDLTTKIYLQEAALAALPQKFVAAATFIDDTAPPKDRPFPYFDTPPIKDFDFRQYITKDKNNDDDDDDDDESGTPSKA